MGQFDKAIADYAKANELLGNTDDLRLAEIHYNRPPKFSPRRIRLLRQRFGMSQTIFARLLAVSPVTLQKWEQGAKTPSPQSCRLVEIAEQHPEIVAERLEVRSVVAGTK